MLDADKYLNKWLNKIAQGFFRVNYSKLKAEERVWCLKFLKEVRKDLAEWKKVLIFKK